MNVVGLEAVNRPDLAEETVRKRLHELRRELNVGESELRELQRRQGQLRDTLLRISGAVQVLEELTGNESAGAATASGK